MKKLIITLILCVTMLSACASAEDGTLLFLRPYAYDAVDYVECDYPYENMLCVDYGPWVLWLECATWDGLGISEDYLNDVFGTCDNNTVAWIAFDTYYGYYGQDTSEYLNCISEGSAIVDGRETVFFNARNPDEYGGGIVTGAIIAENGYVCFLECEGYEGQSLEEMRELRSYALDCFMSAEDAINPAIMNKNKSKNTSFHKGGPWNQSAEETADEEAISFSAGGAYTITPKDANGFGYVDDSLYVYKDGKYIYSFYVAYEDYGLSRTGMMSEYTAEELDMKLAEAFLNKAFTPDQLKMLELRDKSVFDGGTCVYFNDMNSDSSPSSGAIILDSDGVLFVECYAFDNSLDMDDMDEFLRDNLGCIQRNGIPVVGD